MKKLLLFLLLVTYSVSFALPLSPEGRKERDEWMKFLSAVYAQRSGNKKALVQLEKLADASPESNYLKRLVVAEAVAQEQFGHVDPYINFIEQENPSVDDYIVYGMYLASKEDLAGAAAAYEKALALDADSEELLFSYVAIVEGFPVDEAVQKLNRLAEKYPGLATDFNAEIGRLYFQNNRVDEALSYAYKALDKNPEHPRALLLRAGIYEKQQNYLLMLYDLKALEKLGYVNASIYSRMASVYMLMKDVGQAEIYFWKAKKANPQDDAANYFLALVAESKKDYIQAAKYIQESSSYETSTKLLLQASYYFSAANMKKESLAALEKAYRLDPDNVETLFFYGLALEDAEQFEQAAAMWARVVQNRPSYEEARIHYAFMLAETKQYKEMEVQAKWLLEKNPQNAAVLNLLAYALAEQGERLKEAEEYSTRALAISPDFTAFVDTMAWIYYKQGRFKEADGLLSALDKSELERNAEIAYHLGAVRVALGRKEEAKPYLKMAADKYPAAAKLLRKLK